MAQTSQLLTTLKRLLKREGKTYTDVAECLSLSEPSVKRLFSSQNISLQRLDSICHLLEIEISELVFEMQQDNIASINELTHEQEVQIANSLELLLITVLVLNRWSLDQIMQHYKFGLPECIRHLAHLDRLGMIELQPNNRIRLLASPYFKWRENGPIQQVFREKIEQEYFRSSFTRDTEHLSVLNVMLSKASGQQFQRKLERLACEFDETSKNESGLEIGERKGSTVILAIRDWDYGELYGLYRTAKH
uniref:Cro/C1-type HTH DNA-binding domain-containing protein n=1 Tax=uncultured Thiotrichaceae bacterium TaxID=298394 RepID=A0A6S6UF33_9GAMM|nr:MAG: Cro/C1-type HTH DNA-binding domain-containing protein [uncultured Thiotrichaceae bacterium]